MAPAPLAGLPTPPSYRGLEGCKLLIPSYLYDALRPVSSHSCGNDTYIEVVGEPLPLVTAEGGPQLLRDLGLRDRGGPGGAGQSGENRHSAQAHFLFCRKEDHTNFKSKPYNISF